ncbi:MAG: hypothetical protein HY774_10920 [Acidobacteria bacterium]|nr:hypothetical protein [Acidobacteriota bacterium]
MLKGNVGQGERNDKGDVLEIQKLLNLNVKNVPGMQSIVEDRNWGWHTQQALIAFQRAKVRGISQRSLGRVKPGDETFAALLFNADSTTNRPPNLRESADSIRQRVQQSEFVVGVRVVGPWTSEGPSPRELTSAEIPKNGNREIRWELPEHGLGFVTYNRFHPGVKGNIEDMPDQIGTRETIDRLRTLGREWYQRHSSRPIQIGDISRPGGISFPPHGSHRDGKTIDMRPIRKDSKWGPGANVSYSDSTYDRALTKELIQLILRLFPVREIFFNDEVIYNAPGFKGIVKYKAKHNDHLHVVLV